MATLYKITAVEALTALKVLFPSEYMSKIEVCRNEILRMQRTHNKPLQKIFDTFFEALIAKNHRFAVLVAFQQLTDESNPVWVTGEIKRLQKEIEQVVNQLQYLDKNISNPNERAELRQYYENLCVQNEQRIGQLAICLEVVDPEYILPPPNLFTQYATKN